MTKGCEHVITTLSSWTQISLKRYPTAFCQSIQLNYCMGFMMAAFLESALERAYFKQSHLCTNSLEAAISLLIISILIVVLMPMTV